MFISSSASFPISLFCLNTIEGSLLDDTCISFKSSLSNLFCLDVACFALEAFALNLAMNFSKSISYRQY
jgi:hypothetical protein